jgi:hypothetical protein
MQDRMDKQNQVVAQPKKEEDDPFSMLKKKKPKPKVEESPDKKKENDEDGNSSARKSKKGKKKGPNILRGIGSNKDLEMKEDGTVPKVIVKENNEAVDLLKQADDKLKKVLDMYVPAKGSSSEKSKSSQRSKSSTGTIKSKPAAATLIRPIVQTSVQSKQLGKDADEDATFNDYKV